MPMVSMRQLLDEAAKGGYGVGAFNVNNMEQIQAIMEAAKETQSPVIVQASRGARSYTNDRFLYHLMMAATELYPEIPIALHQDHGNSPDTCKSAIAMGFTSVMMDGSLMPDGKTPADSSTTFVLLGKLWIWRMTRASPWKANSVRWAEWKMGMAQTSMLFRTSPIPTRLSSSSNAPASMRLRLPLVPAMAHTNLRRSPLARCS